MENTRCTGSGPRTITTRRPALVAALVGRDQAAQARGIEEDQLGQIEHDRLWRARLHPVQLVLELRRAGQVELTPERNVHESVAVLGSDVEDLHRTETLASDAPRGKPGARRRAGRRSRAGTRRTRAPARARAPRWRARSPPPRRSATAGRWSRRPAGARFRSPSWRHVPTIDTSTTATQRRGHRLQLRLPEEDGQAGHEEDAAAHAEQAAGHARGEPDHHHADDLHEVHCSEDQDRRGDHEEDHEGPRHHLVGEPLLERGPGDHSPDRRAARWPAPSRGPRCRRTPGRWRPGRR